MGKEGIHRTTHDNQKDLLLDLIGLHLPDGIDCDVTYSKGIFYKGLEEYTPKLKFDINPQTEDTTKADCRHLPLENSSINSIIFDPPFVIGSGPSLNSRKKGTNIISNRFGIFKNYKNLMNLYSLSLKEFHRVLKDKGTLVFKCQDTVAWSRNHFTHCHIWYEAIKRGFYPKDLYILNAKSRLISSKVKKQQHARKFHSYFWIFKKERCKVDYGCI